MFLHEIFANNPQPLLPKIPNECDSSITKVIFLVMEISSVKERSIGFTSEVGTASVRIVIFSILESNNLLFNLPSIKTGKLPNFCMAL